MPLRVGASPLRSTMVVTELGAVVHRVPIGPSFWSVTVGRSPNNEVVVTDRAVSGGRNTRFIFENQRFVVEDLGSTNGTLVNGRRIHRQVLRVGDQVRLGVSVVVFFEHTLAAAGATSVDSWLASVLATPEDMAPRRVYGDWLSQKGDPRGEFIQVQIALSGLPASDPRQRVLQERARALLEAHEADWLASLSVPVESWTFTRGFIEAVRVGEASQRAGVRGELTRFHPLLRLDSLLA